MSEAKREVWRCSYTGASGAEVGVQWYEEEKQRDAYLEVMPIKGNPVAVRYIPEHSTRESAQGEGWVAADVGEYPDERQFAWVDVPGHLPTVMQWKAHHWWGLDYRGNSVALRMSHVARFRTLPPPPKAEGK